MEKEYIKLYSHYSKIYGLNTCIFLMVGKFYELYDSINPETGEPHTSLLRAAELLNIQISEKDEGRNGTKSFFGGVPEYVLHKYAAVLTRNNWTVIVCDQIKDDTGKVIERTPVRILSPGTHYETATAEAPYVASIWLEEHFENSTAPDFGLALFDLTTGITTGFQGKATGTNDVWSADTLVQAIQIHNPKEILVFWRGDALSKPNETLMRSRLGGTQALIHIRMASSVEQGAFEKHLVRSEFLTSHYQPQTMLPILHYLHLESSPHVERALIGLLRFMEDHLPSSLENLQPFQPWTPNGRVHLGNNALTQLNVTSGRIEDSLLGLYQKTITSMGKRGMRNRLLTPISNVQELHKRLGKIQYLFDMPKNNQQMLERYLRQLYDFPRIHRRIMTYTLTAEDVLNLEQTYNRIKDIAVFFANTVFCISSEMFEELLYILREFQNLFNVEKAKVSNQDVYFLNNTIAPKTAAIEEQILNCRKELETKIEELCIYAGLPKDTFFIEMSKESQIYQITGSKKNLTLLKNILARRIIEERGTDRVVSVQVRNVQSLPARTDKCPLANIEVVIKKTAGGTIECPYLNEIQTKVANLRVQLQAAFKEELAITCQKFIDTNKNQIWEHLEHWITDIDVSYCIARVSEARGFCRPTILENKPFGSVEIEGLRHPLIEATNNRVAYVQHNVSLGTDEKTPMGWLVYGMNASGKSSLMKAVGVTVLLAQTGCFVPATKCEVSPFHAILTRILNQDNLWAGLSSFAVEMSELRDILMRADPYSLILGDELCSGTESVSATALVASGIENLLKANSRFIFATHLHGLMDLPQIAHHTQLGIYHLKVNYDAARDILIYDRSLHKGAGSSLYGIEVARALHLPHEFLESAVKIRKMILGKQSEEDAQGSAWNSQVIRKKCQVCGHDIVRDLEVHHIRPRAEANGLHFSDGTNRDSRANLIVVCQKCHDKHHAGEINIQPFVQTSQGPLQLTNQVILPEPEKQEDSKKQIILNTLRRLPNVPLRRIVYDLEVNHGILVSETTLRKYRKEGEMTIEKQQE